MDQDQRGDCGRCGRIVALPQNSFPEANGPSSSTSPTLSNNSDQQSKPRSIHFSPEVNVKTIPSLNAYSPKRLQKMYYSKDDLDDQKAEYKATAKEMRRRHRRGEDPLQVHEVKLKVRQEHDRQPSFITSTTTRGLEHLVSSRTLDLHRQEQRDAIGAVLLAQENDFTHEEIAILYSHRAQSAKTRARNLGLADAQL